MQKNELITVEQQLKSGVRLPPKPKPPDNFVNSGRRDVVVLPQNYNHNTTLDITPSATQYVEVKTSARDRSIGFNIAIAPLALLLGILGVIAAWWAGAPWFSVGVLLVFVGGFTVTWLIAYGITLLLTPEFISLYESFRKWNVVDREQEERWHYYNRDDRK